MKRKYLVRPGYVISINDDERHYINGRQLIRLYNVNPLDCIISRNPKGFEYDFILRPKYNGDYRLPRSN